MIGEEETSTKREIERERERKAKERARERTIKYLWMPKTMDQNGIVKSKFCVVAQ